jgi:hypothetical protein
MKKSPFWNYDTASQAGIQLFQWILDSRLRGSDGFKTFYDSTFSSHVKENEETIFDRRQRSLASLRAFQLK